MNKDYGKYFGSAMMIGFGVLALYRWHQTQLIFFLLLVLRDFAAGFFFFKRRPTQTRSSTLPSVLAYASSAMPLLYLGPTIADKSLFLASDLLAILGFLIVVLATIELGTSIGISPANRGLVRTGIYRLIRHPMYVGYVVSEIGMAILNPLNVILVVISASMYAFRAKLENKALNAMVHDC